MTCRGYRVMGTLRYYVNDIALSSLSMFINHNRPRPPILVFFPRLGNGRRRETHGPALVLELAYRTRCSSRRCNLHPKRERASERKDFLRDDGRISAMGRDSPGGRKGGAHA